MTKCCIFDLDGTLLNTLGTIKFYMNETLARRGIPPIDDRECMSFVGSGAGALMHRACLSRNIYDAALEEEMLLEYMRAYDESPYYLTEKYEGIDRLLDGLSTRGISLAVLSNKPDFATRAAVAHFFEDVFDTVHGGRENIPLKPSPDGALEILSALGFSPAECAYIGDSDVDFKTGERLGAALNISVTWGFRSREELSSVGARNFANSALELENIIKSYEGR